MSHRSRLPLVRIAALVAVIAGGAITVPAAATDRVVVVQPGDTLSEIALKHGVTITQLRALNGIANPNRIYVGQRLRLIGSAQTAPVASAAKAAAVVHVVAWGENLTEIARRYGSTITAIARANGIANPSLLRVGQRLVIPGTKPSTKPPAPAASTPPSAPAVASKVHIVAWGENLTGIARRYGSTITAIARANGIANPSFLRVGQRLVIPGTGTSASLGGRMPASMSSLVAKRKAIGDLIRAEALARGVPVALALAVAWQESGWQTDVVSHAGAVGVMQLTPATADWVAVTMLGHRVDLSDARSNVRAGVVLLRHYLDRYHWDRSLVLAAYYQGQTAADRHGLYAVTRPYVASILALEKLFGS